MSNFNFIKEIDEELYNLCIEAEKYVYTNARLCLNHARIAYEHFIVSIFNEKSLTATKNPTLLDMEKLVFLSRLIPSELSDKARDIRNYGNEAHHAIKANNLNSKKASKVKFNFALAMQVMESLHEIIGKTFVHNKKIKKYEPFNRNKCLINDYIPIEILKNEEYEEGCIRKIKCLYELDGIKKYYILRQFDSKKKNDPVIREFTKRDFEILSNLSNEVGVENIAKYQKVSTAKDNDFFFIAYEVGENEETLQKTNLTELTKEQRLELLLQIANGLTEMHEAESPVYHRAITPNSIFIQRLQKGKLKAKIANFEYAKIFTDNGVTVFKKVVDRREDAFRAREIMSGATIENWEKVDVYSFAVLILYMFEMPVINPQMEVRRLAQKGLSKELIELVQRGLHLAPNMRPSMSEFKKALTREVVL